MDSGDSHANENGCYKNEAAAMGVFHRGNNGAAGKEQIGDAVGESGKRVKASVQNLIENVVQQKDEASEMGTAARVVCSRNGSVSGHLGENPNSDVLTAVSTQSRLQRRAHGDGPLEDLVSWYHQQDQPEDDDDDEGDSDWEPHLQPTVSEKWLCINCTMPNFDNVLHCDFCGEIQESEILTKGSFASNVSREGFPDDAEAIAGHLEPCMEWPPSKDCTLVGFDERMLLHSEVEQKSHPHPERPDRLRAIAASFAVAGIFPGRCFPIPAREASLEELGMIHSMEHVNAVKATSYMLSSYFTSDTYANGHSARAARLAAGLCADLASAIMQGHARNGFALVRPPGHHAGLKQPMGFCLHNNAAVAALAAQAAGADRVLIVDWDVHHGNGTQEIFEENRTVLYISLHRHEDGRFYPGTGAANEIGGLGAEGYSVNIPWKCGGIGDNDYLFAFEQVVLPIALQFAPDFTIISAGFDAAQGDPLGGCSVTPTGFAQMTHMLMGLSKGKLLLVLEGGYNLRSISSSSTAVVKVLLGEKPAVKMGNILPSKSGLQTLLEVLDIQLKFWSNLEPCYAKVCSLWKSSHARGRRKRQHFLCSGMLKKKSPGLLWWNCGRRRLIYALLFGRQGRKAKVAGGRKGSGPF